MVYMTYLQKMADTSLLKVCYWFGILMVVLQYENIR